MSVNNPPVSLGIPGTAAMTGKENGSDTAGGSHKGYWESRIAKNKAQKPKAATCVLKGVVVYFTGTARSSRYDMERMVFENGGEVLPFLARKKVTHVVAENMALSKVDKELKLAASGNQMNVVHPNWLKQSVKKGRKLPLKDFLIVRSQSSAAMATLLGGHV